MLFRGQYTYIDGRGKRTFELRKTLVLVLLYTHPTHHREYLCTLLNTSKPPKKKRSVQRIKGKDKEPMYILYAYQLGNQKSCAQETKESQTNKQTRKQSPLVLYTHIHRQENPPPPKTLKTLHLLKRQVGKFCWNSSFHGGIM